MYLPFLLCPRDAATAHRLLLRLARLELAQRTGEGGPEQRPRLEARREQLWQFICLYLQQRHEFSEDHAADLVWRLARQVLYNPEQVRWLQRHLSLAAALGSRAGDAVLAESSAAAPFQVAG